MSKVLFFNLPAHGHINPTLPLVAELVRRGEQVIYYSSPGFRQTIEATGATFRESITPYLNDETQISENMFHVAHMLLETTRLAIPTLLPEAREERPDYTIHDGLAPWGNYIGQLLGVPSICSMTTFAIPPPDIKLISYLLQHPGELKLLNGSFGDDLLPILLEGRIVLPQFNTLATNLHKKYHVPKPQLNDVFNNQSLMNIVYTTRQFQPFNDLFDDRYKFVGPSIIPRPHDHSFPFEVLLDKPIIYISLGTVFSSSGKVDFYRTCFEAFAGSDMQIVLSVGSRTDVGELGPIPPNFIVRGFVPQLELLQRAALLITHGGMNSVSEALYYNVPLVTIPQTADQYLVGQRIEQLGVGKTLRKKRVIAQTLRQAAEEVLSQVSYRQASTTIGASLRTSKGYLNAADEIARFKEKYSIA